MTIELVVAKYTENISWTHACSCKVTVYDKSADRPNIGREAETYLYHIITNYDNLADLTVFLQGNPRDHMMGRIESFINAVNNGNIVHGPAQTGRIHREEGIVVLDPYRKEINACYKQIVDDPPLDMYYFSTGAQYIVDRDVIRRWPLSKWQEIHQLSVTNVICPWSFERLWPVIFDIKGLEAEFHRRYS